MRLATRALLLCALLTAAAVHGAEPALERDGLRVFDESRGDLDRERHAALAQLGERALAQLLTFWQLDAVSAVRGTIELRLRPAWDGYYGAQFQFATGAAGRVRTVFVFGVRRAPQELAHKLTHALFPSPDKLVRNMMGIPGEMRFGNMDSFPMCGLHPDDWVLALRDAGAYRPLRELTPENEPWGQTMGRDGLLVMTDERRQHISYAQAGSFGAFLLNSHGPAAMKRFYRITNQTRQRPWNEVYGRGLEDLERDWLAALEAARPARVAGVAEAFRLQSLRGARMCPPRTGD